MMLTILVPDINPRVNYIFSLVFSDLLGISYTITDHSESFTTLTTPKFSYNYNSIGEELFFFASPLLFEKTIEKQTLNVQQYSGFPVFFENNHSDSALPFDPFAASFFLVTRYEEYLENEKDEHGRFPAQKSLAFQHRFLDKPIVNYWVAEIKVLLQNRFPELTFKPPAYKFTPTYDVDYAWAYLHKGLIRNTFNLLKCLITFDKSQFTDRWLVLRGKKPDPYFTFPDLEKTFTRFNLSPIFFFLVGKYGLYDKNVSLNRKPFQNLIKKLNKTYQIGLHPSHGSHFNKKTINFELQQLSNVTTKSIDSSRQHFLLLDFPRTYQLLSELNIKHDYTMGYASETGFRAGIAHPFFWYDLSTEKTTSLMVHSFQFMDVTLKNYKKLCPKSATSEVINLLNETKKVGGHFITLWHNNSLSDSEDWKGWRAVHDFICESAVKVD